MSIDMESPSRDSMASCSCRPTSTIPSSTYAVFSLTTASTSSDDESCHTLESIDDLSVGSLDVDIDDMDPSSFKETLCSVSLPPIETVLPESTQTTLPPVIQALHQFEHDIRTLRVSAIAHYQDLRVSTVELHATLPPRGHVDGGAMANTTDRLDYLWSYRECTPDERRSLPRLQVADDTVHIPHGYGYIKVPCQEDPGYLFMLCLYTPQIPATIVSPDRLGRTLSCTGYHTYSDFVNNVAILELTGCDSGIPELHIALQRIRGLLYTDSLIAPSPSEHSAIKPPPFGRIHGPHTTTIGLPRSPTPVRPMSLSTQRDLWHMRLGHANSRVVSELHKHAKGIPKLPRTDALDHCHLCARAKLHKSSRGDAVVHECTSCWQHIQVDFGFFVVQSAGRKSTSSSTPKSKRSRSKQPTDTMRAVELRRSTRLQSQRSSSDPPPSAAPVTPSPPNPSPSGQHYTFTRILTHEGPITRSHKRFRGSAWNLKILWSTQETTWEPLHLIFEDAPLEVVQYARAHNLLDNPDWAFVRDAALDPSFSSSPADFDDETELADSLPFDPESVTVDPIDDADAAAKAQAATLRY